MEVIKIKENGFTIYGRCISPELQDILNKVIKAIDDGNQFQIRESYYYTIMDFLLSLGRTEEAEKIAKYEHKYIVPESRYYNTISLNTNNYKPNRAARRAAAKQNRKRGR